MSHPADGGDESTVLAFPTEVVREVADFHDSRRRSGDREDSPFRLSYALVSPAVSLRLHRLRSALRAAAAGALSAEDEALGILSAVLRDALRAESTMSAPRRPVTRQARRELVEAVKETLARTMGEASPTLAQLSAKLATSPFHLTRTFREEMGLPIHRYLLRLRLGVALQRIVDESASLSTIALDAGFSSHAHFTDAFRRLFGVTPSSLRAPRAPRIRMAMSQV